MLKINSTQLVTLALLVRLYTAAQSPATIVFPNPTPNPPNAAVDSYTRATTKINLKNGFKYGFVSGGASNLLNLNISAYPGYVNNNYVNPSSTPNYFDPNPDLEASVTPGAFSVSDNGGINYSMPVVCSPGTAGMEPKLSISYSNNGTNNWMGLGFDVNGISVITRIGKSVLYDGKNGGIQFNGNDVFALDGSRLLLSGQSLNPYGQDNATYKTTIENYYTITSKVITQGNGPSYFTVSTPDGLSMEYGNTADSKCLDNGGTEILAWYVNKVYDAFGNYMTYSYINTGGELLIDKIEYTGNSNNSLNPYNKIEFTYMQRADANSHYFAGKEFKRTKILKNITSKDLNGNTVRKYVFDYQYEFASLLSKITEVDAAGNQLNPTCFTWTGGSKSQTYLADFTNPYNSGFGTSLYRLSIAADLNGDGRKDLVLLKNQGLELLVKINTEQLTAGLSPIEFVSSGNPINVSYSAVGYIASFVFDEDDDDLEEVFIVYTNSSVGYKIDKLKNVNGSFVVTTEYTGSLPANNTGSWEGLIFYNLQTTFLNNSTYFYAKEDVSGDNLNDIIRVDQLGLSVSVGANSPVFVSATNIIKTALGDFDGDGVQDIYVLKTINQLSAPYQCDVYKYDAQSNAVSIIATLSVNANHSPFINSWVTSIPNSTLRNMANAGKAIDFGDFNGDGKMDIMYINYTNSTNANAYVLKSNGLTFLPDNNPMVVPVKLNGCEANYSSMDVNNDGYSDLVLSSYDNVNKQTVFDHYPSNGNFLTSSFGSNAYTDQYLGALSDFNGDGALDYVFQNGFVYTGVVYNAFNQNNKKLVNHIFNIKNDLKITYGYLPGEKPATWVGYEYYLKGSLANTDPAFKNKKPQIYVVSETNYNGRRIYYGYKNSVFHRQGSGFLGFEKVFRLERDKSINFNTEFRGSVTNFGYDASFDLINSIDETQAYFTGPGSFNLNTSKVAANNLQTFNYTQNGTSRYLNTTTSVTKNYLSSTYNTVTTSFDNSSGGLILSSVRSGLNWLTQQPINTVQYDYTYQSLSNPYSTISYFRGKKVTETRTANNAISSYITDFTYNQTGHLTSTVANSNIGADAVTTTYSQFNAFGTALVISVTAPDLTQARTKTLQYDPTGRFITQSADVLNNTTQSVYEPAYGNLVQSTGIDGQVVKFEYDGLGRLIRTISPTGTINRKKYEWYNISGATYGIKATADFDGNGTLKTYFNKNDAVVKTEATGFGGNTVVSEKQYDVMGVLLSSTPDRFLTQNLYKVYTYGYDDFYRPTNISEQNNSGSVLKTISYSYNALSTNATYNKGFVKLQSPSGNGTSNHFEVSENNEAGQVDKLINYTNVNAQHSSAYTFNQHGLPTQVATTFPGGSGGSIATFAYDALGRRQSINDPSSGLNTFDYNSIGELVQSVSPNGTYTFEYDALGRLTKRTGSGQGIYTYNYVATGNGKAQLKKITGPSGLTEYTYDSNGRPTEKKETLGAGIAAKEFKTKYTYDPYNRLVDYTYPNNFKITHEYDVIGQLAKIKNNTATIWELTGMKSPDQVESYKNGAGITTQITYDNYLNLSQINLGNINSQGFTVINTSANMSGRTQQNFVSNANNNEGFDYDAFDRLQQTNFKDANNNTVVKDVYTYKENGNLDYKQDCGNYVYGLPSKPYQLTGIQNPVGNISLNSLNITHNDFDKVSQIAEATTNKLFDFTYGNSGQRAKMEYRLNNQLQYTRYYQDNYDRQETTNTYKDWCYIYSPTGLAAVYYDNNGTKELLDVTSDHLGSPLLLTNQTGQIVEEYSFDAWGRRRNPADWTYNNIPASTKMIRGYTGHEHLDEVGLINMNGRMYDAVLGRFVQPDPIIQDPGNIQNLNRYSYVLNNPVNYNDPSGYRSVRPTGGLPPEGPSDGSSYVSPRQVLYVDGMRIEPGGAGYTMYGGSAGGGGEAIGVASTQYFGVWTGNGPGLKNFSLTRAAMIDFANSHPGSVTRINGSGAYIQLTPLAFGSTKTVFGNPITGALSASNIFDEDGSVVGAIAAWTEFGAQSGGGITSDQVTQLANIGLGTAGLLLNTAQVAAYNDISQTARRTGNIAEALLSKYSIDKTIGKVSQKLGYAGVAINGLNLAYKYNTGKEIKTRDLVDFGIGAALSVIAISNPIGILALGIYGIADAYGAFDGIKETYLGQTVIPGKK